GNRSEIGEIFKNMKEEDADRIAEVFKTNEPTEVFCSINDLRYLSNQLNGYRHVVNDDIFLLQPFITRRMGLAQAMLTIRRELYDAINDLQLILLIQNSKEAVSSIQLEKDVITRYRRIGQTAI